MSTLVLLRHGLSKWNQENRFTGWMDVPLSERGEEEAKQAGKILKFFNYDFDCCFASILKRAIKTAWIVLEEMDLMQIPVIKSWRLNERHYGALQGRNKARTAEEFGEKQVFFWRRGYDILPPALETAEQEQVRKKKAYPLNKPLTESLEMTIFRVLPFWVQNIGPRLNEGEDVLVCAHGNSLRGLVKYLDGLSPKEIVDFEIPTAVPLAYELDEELRPVNRKFLKL